MFKIIRYILFISVLGTSLLFVNCFNKTQQNTEPTQQGRITNTPQLPGPQQNDQSRAAIEQLGKEWKSGNPLEVKIIYIGSKGVNGQNMLSSSLIIRSGATIYKRFGHLDNATKTYTVREEPGGPAKAYSYDVMDKAYREQMFQKLGEMVSSLFHNPSLKGLKAAAEAGKWILTKTEEKLEGNWVNFMLMGPLENRMNELNAQLQNDQLTGTLTTTQKGATTTKPIRVKIFSTHISGAIEEIDNSFLRITAYDKAQGQFQHILQQFRQEWDRRLSH